MRMNIKAQLGATACPAAGLVLSAAATARAADILIPQAEGTVIVPESSQPVSNRPHTNVRIFQPRGQTSPAATSPSGKYETPASLACLYGLTAKETGCNPETLKTVTTGGSKVVAIVDAYDYPTAKKDLAAYSKQYGLPAVTSKNFEVVYAGGKKPAQDSSGGWELEEALDIEMAHGLAPSAKVILVEANSNSFTDLFAAETVASNLVAKAGGGEVSNSWSGGEFSGEEQYESTFATNGVVYFASSGDAPGIGVPAALSNVVAVGGTSVNRDANANYLNQTAWVDTGGGSSAYVPVPSYQSPISKIVGSFRGTPDISLVADPNTGVWIYDTTPYQGQNLQWLVIGGTSVASPALAALVNNASNFFTSTVAELTTVYAGFKNQANWTDIKGGTCGSNGKTTKAVKGWDFCTGVGTPYGRSGK